MGNSNHRGCGLRGWRDIWAADTAGTRPVICAFGRLILPVHRHLRQQQRRGVWQRVKRTRVVVDGPQRSMIASKVRELYEKEAKGW